MEQIKLNDLLHISKDSDDYKTGKITFCDHMFLDYWLRRTPEEDKNGSGFSFYAKDSSGRNILHDGTFVITTVQLDKPDLYLLTSVSRVTKVFEGDGPSEREGIEEYRKWFGRVIIRVAKEQGTQGYNFKIETFLDRCEVVEILPKTYGGKKFPGYANVCVKMRELSNYLNNTHIGEDWKNKLSAVKAVYCLNNHDENKVYIGSAYNKNGLMGRWQNYFDTSTGGNVELKKVLENHKDDANYFLDNFYFSVLETFSLTASDDEIISRESYWKDVFNSRDSKQGYNKN